MSFTDQEVADAVAKLVRTSIRRTYGALGNRRTDLTANDTRNAAAGVFILFGNAPFYVVKLAADRLTLAVESEQEQINNFIEALGHLGRRVRGVGVTSLENARVALQALSSATAQRSTSLVNIEDVSAFQRFETNTKRFLDESKHAITSSGAIVQTPDEARAELGNLFTALQAAHADVVRRATILRDAIADFESASLPATLLQSILENATSVLTSHIEELEALTAEERLSVLRGVTLDILAMRSTVRGFGSLTAPTQFLVLDGTGSVFADTTHAATPALLSTDKYGPYTVLDAPGAGSVLDFSIDGDVGSSVTTSIQLLGSFVAQLDGVAKGPYDIGSPNSVGVNTDRFSLGLKNWSALGALDLVEVTLPSNPTMGVHTLAKEINDDILAGAPLMPLFAEPYANPLKYTGSVDLTAPGGTFDVDIVAPSGTVNFADLLVTVGDTIRVIDPTSSMYGTGSFAFGALFEVMAVTTTVTPFDTLECNQITSLVLSTETGKLIEIGEGTMPMRLRIQNKASEPAGDYRVQALDDRVSIFMPESTGTITKADQFSALTSAGLYPLMEAPSRPTDARLLATAISQSAAALVGGALKLSATAVFIPTLFVGVARTDPNEFLRVVLLKQAALASSLSVLGLVGTFDVAGAVTAGVLPGDVVVIRTHTDPLQVNNWGVVTTVTDTQVVAVMNIAPVAGTGLQLELGPDVRAFPFNPTLKVLDGVNRGTYEVLNVVDPTSIVPIELSLSTTFPFPAGAGNQPIELLVELGQWRLDLESQSSLLDTAVSVDGTLPEDPSTARARFFDDVTNMAVGSTPYFQLPTWPKALEEGDLFELYSLQFDSPAFATVIQGLEESQKIVSLAQSLSTDLAPYTFTRGSEVPFARIRKFQMNNYQTLRTNLAAWLELSSSQASFFLELQRLLNPLAVNTNPTLAQLNDPKLKLQELGNDLTTLSISLGLYEARPVEQVDTLIETFTQKGADRAVKLLLEAQFSTFFGLDQDELSFTGQLQKNVRSVERNDLPVRKTERLNHNVARDALVASYEEPDFEFDQSDVESFPDENIDVPAGSGKMNYPGGSY